MPEIEIMDKEPEEVKPIKTKKQLDAKKRFNTYYDKHHRGKQQKRTCECGIEVSYLYLYEHRKTKKHANFMSIREKIKEELNN